MKAIAVLSPGVVKVVDDVPVPVPGDYEVLVKVRACGFCNGTDFQIINNTMGDRENCGHFPTVLGHEGVGDAVQLGAKVRYIKLGDRFIHPNLRPNVGNGYFKNFGGMVEYGLVADHAAMLEDGFAPDQLPFRNKFAQIPDDFDPIHGAMLLSLCETLSAARNFGCDPTKDVLVYGAGPMGLALMTFMKLVGVKSITVIDSIDERLEKAVKLAGADQAINFQHDNVDEVLKGRLFDIAVDAVGSTKVIIEASHRLKPFGRVGSMGVLRDTDVLVNAAQLKNNTLLHMLNFPYGEYSVATECVRYIQEGRIDPKNFYSHVLPMEQIEEALELVRSKKALKVILTIGSQD